MTIALDTKRIRNSAPCQLATYYDELRAEASEEIITAQLLNAVESGSIPPITFSPWLGITKSPSIIRHALQQNHSVEIRRLGIKYFRKRLNSVTWRDAWAGVGGTSGVLGIFADLSVKDIRSMCKALGHFATGKHLVEKREQVTELYKGLHPSIYPDTKYKTTDQRPLAAHYGLLLPACTQDLVEAAVAEGSKGVGKHARERDLVENHPECLGEIQLSRLRDEGAKPVNQNQIKALANRYRTTLSSKDGFSLSMDYSLACLRTLTSIENTIVDEPFVVNATIQPLLNRAVRKRVAWDNIHEIVDLALKYLERKPAAGKILDSSRDHIVHLVACCWSRKPQLFESQLRTFFNHPVYGFKALDELTSWGNFLLGTLPARRYELMQFCIKVSTGLDIDVDIDLSKVKGTLTHELLASLEPSRALEFFNRVRKVRGDYAFLGGSRRNSILQLGVAYHVMIREPPIWHFHLLKQNGDLNKARKLAEEYIEGRKRSAKTASQPEQRGHHAKSALFAAIASGSLDCYRDTLKWADRFLNDQLVLREVHPQTYPIEAVRLLSGIPEPIDSSMTMSELRDGVEKANSILSGMFDTACTAILQPSFFAPAWSGVLYMFRRVVVERIRLTSALTKALAITTDELYDSLWGGTIAMLVTVEEKANSEAYKKLSANLLQGLFSRPGNEEIIKVATNNPSAIRFLDQLAMARDVLWRKLRSVAYPHMSTMPECLPRGLAIQHLVPQFTLNVENLDTLAPYLASRVSKALFPDPKLAFQVIPVDKKAQDCIGVFVDSYEHALQLYIPECCSETIKKNRVKEVWAYATGPLSQDRLKKRDIDQYWNEVEPDDLQRLWPPRKYQVITVWPVLPDANEPGAPVTWNPPRLEGSDTPAKEPEAPTYIDVSVGVSRQTRPWPTINDTLRLKDLIYTPYSSKDGTDELWGKHGMMDETKVLLALFYLDEQFNKGGQIQSSYHSKTGVRYPTMYLGEEIWSRKEASPESALRYIQRHLNGIPPQLIHRLAQSAMQALNAVDPIPIDPTTLHEVAMQLVIRLGEDDRPSLAIDLVIDTIINRPKSSSWHRLLLKLSFLHRLSASDAAKCYATLTSRISQVVEDSLTAKAARETEAVESTDLPGKDNSDVPSESPYIKVTTLKLLMQLITGTSIVGEHTAISTIGSLATIATHTDVRLAMVKALLSMLVCYDMAHADSIFKILESTIAPAENLNERDPITEANWQKAEVTLEPPDIHDIVDAPISTSSPILEALLQHLTSDEITPQTRQTYLSRIILPIFAKLKQQTARWISIFLRKHGFDEAAQRDLKLPLVPLHTDVVLLRTLMKDSIKLPIFPASIFEDMIAYAIYTIAPPAALAALTKRLIEDTVVRVKPNTQVYLTLYGRAVFNARNVIPGGLFSLLNKLHTKHATLPTASAFSAGGITPHHVHTQTLLLFKTLVQHQPPSSTSLSSLLQPILQGEHLLWPWWSKHGAPILHEMIDHVDSLRTEAWQTDPNRTPSVLPDTFPWRLRLLSFPVPEINDSLESSETKCLKFASQIRSVLAELDNQPIYHTKLQRLLSYIGLEPPTPPFEDHGKRKARRETLQLHRGLVAVYVGDVSGGEEVGVREEVLRVEVAAALLDVVKSSKEGMERKVEDAAREMVRGWKGSGVEEVRRTGFEGEGRWWGVR
ncbi:hypothetical protein NX059_005981 [Plenodomus lindquistii]|nr:hypothetical protein NX059_005981 [Plenodomus lindquistii]